MGLLDWLMGDTSPVQMTGTDAQALPRPEMTDIAGGMQGAGRPPPYPAGTDPMTAGLRPPLPPSQPTQAMPPAQGLDLPPLPFPPGGDPMTAGGSPPNGPGLPFPPGGDPMTAGGMPPNGPGLPPRPQVPMPMARPPGADAGPAALPPAAAPTSGGMPPGPPTSLLPPNAAPPLAPNGGATGPLGIALGLDRNRERTMRGSLGAGLKAAGENANKPGLAAFAGSLGSGIEGGASADDKTSEQQSKYLTQAIAAAQAGNTSALNIARTKLALSQAKALDDKEGKPDKASVINSQEQLYLRGLGSVNQDATVKASLAQLRSLQTQFGPDSKEVKAAMTAHNELIESTKKKVFSTLGVNEKEAAKIGKQPGFAADNPVPAAGLTKDKFDKLPPGSYFINPKDNRLLIKQPPAGANPAAPAQSPTPAAPVPVTAPAGSAADQDDND